MLFRANKSANNMDRWVLYSQSTVIIRITDKSGFYGPKMSGSQMVRFSIGGLKTVLKCLFYGLKCLVFKWSA